MSVMLSAVCAAAPQESTTAADRLGGVLRELDERATATLLRAELEPAAQAELRSRVDAAQLALSTGAAQLAVTRDGLQELVTALRAKGWAVGEDGTAVAPALPSLLAHFAPGFTAIIQRLLGLFADIDATTAAAVRAAIGETDSWWSAVSDSDSGPRLVDVTPELR
ncbi:WXG100 family type VII secretion target [Mycolicibacterium vaccae]|uniref:WXG100 family type VII secretion target n=1 Tax=Mycolicibacterium vaccae TaxID=1810 RepID=UPI003CF10B16